MVLSRLLAREQRAFLGRSRRGWDPHLARVRAFIGDALDQADAADDARPTLILGAGSGLEIPWRRAPKDTVGWDADPCSRLRTLLRHRRFPEWVFADLTGGLAALEATVRRACIDPMGRRRTPEQAMERLAGLLPSLDPQADALRAWIETHRPSTVIVANVLGQIGCVAQRQVEGAFGGMDPWDDAFPASDRLAKSLDAWTARALAAVLGCLASSGAEVWMVHDRAVLWGEPDIALGPIQEDWRAQLLSSGTLNVSDPWCGLEPLDLLRAMNRVRLERWLWRLDQGQLHIMEAVAYSSKGSSRGTLGVGTCDSSPT
ncbi:MAG TPA: hypothetical protein PKL14_03080 [Holophaga sp.]|nr:hypothetical protein [Holophaga sp.]